MVVIRLEYGKLCIILHGTEIKKHQNVEKFVEKATANGGDQCLMGKLYAAVQRLTLFKCDELP